jgi:hypothetical protein
MHAGALSLLSANPRWCLLHFFVLTGCVVGLQCVAECMPCSAFSGCCTVLVNFVQLLGMVYLLLGAWPVFYRAAGQVAGSSCYTLGSMACIASCSGGELQKPASSVLFLAPWLGCWVLPSTGLRVTAVNCLFKWLRMDCRT